ncbi:uncharacterized protein LY89DRAFT_764528 [Mollisia scopiformis]|uniref:Uncharacterized protein n=1 Tax=Mollisia scopiformis TaxID=149040 RepID=A0A132B7T2_MOLSC|nr:uncharacterized protein LY89DRAFT_764528 [Mollisia scopiformis]KUJ08421.1 hypothetical protein LY89DRAFT_764528 [Mollisia scopiformis]
MDPATILAITGACVGITRNAASFVTGLNDLIVRFRDVELDLSAIEAQTGVLGLVSERLRLWINIYQDELSDIEWTRLWECVYKLRATSATGVQRRKLSIWKRGQALFAQPQLQRYARALEQQGNAVNAFLQVFQRPAALQNKRTSIIIDGAISSASKTSAEIMAWLQQVDTDEGTGSDRDSGFFQDTASNASSNRSSTTVSINTESLLTHPSQLTPLHIPHLSDGIYDRDHRQRGHITRRAFPRPYTTHRRVPDPRSNSSNLNQNVRHRAAPEDPGGDDSPPSSDSDDSDNVTTVSYMRSSDLDDSDSVTTYSAYGIRDQLQRMSIASSPFHLNQQPADPMAENIHSDLVRLQEIMLELRRNNNSIPTALEAQIERLFNQIRDNLRVFGNEDEQILRGSNIHSRNASGETALHIAAKKRPVDIAAIRRFLNLGASALLKDYQLNTPLLSLVSTKYDWNDDSGDAVSLLLNAGVDINARPNNGWTALSRVTDDMDTRTFGILLESGADVNTTTPDLMTPLHRAAERPSLYGVELLLSRSADPNAISQGGETPLSLVCQLSCAHERAQATIVEKLLTAGARLDAGPAGAKRPLDAVIKALKSKELTLKLFRWNSGDMPSFIWARSAVENSMYTILVLLEHLNTVTLHYTTRTAVQSMYVFRPMSNLESIPISDLRRRFKQRIGEIVVLSNRQLQLYDDLNDGPQWDTTGHGQMSRCSIRRS